MHMMNRKIGYFEFKFIRFCELEKKCQQINDEFDKKLLNIDSRKISGEEKFELYFFYRTRKEVKLKRIHENFGVYYETPLTVHVNKTKFMEDGHGKKTKKEFLGLYAAIEVFQYGGIDTPPMLKDMDFGGCQRDGCNNKIRWPIGKNPKYCCPLCEYEAKKKRFIEARRAKNTAAVFEKVCAFCKEKFTAKKSNALTCSPSCRRNLSRKKKNLS